MVVEQEDILDLSSLLNYASNYFGFNNYPLLIACLKEKDNRLVEASRGFIVSNHWPDLNFIH